MSFCAFFTRRFAICRSWVLCTAGAVSISMGAAAASAADASLGVPALQAKAEARVFQQKSSLGRPFTLFEYPVSTPNSVPHILAIAADDQVWFSQSGGQFARNFIDTPPVGRIGRLDKNGTITEWDLGKVDSSPMGVAFDHEGNLWVTQRLGNLLSRITPSGGVVNVPVPTPNSWPTGLAVDSKNQIWFSETKGNRIGVIHPSTFAVKEFDLPAENSMATGIAVDRQDNVWVAMRDANIIAKFVPSEERFVAYTLPTPDSKPCGLAVGTDGEVWFSQRNGGKIGTISENGTIREHVVPGRFTGPFFLVVDKYGDVWFSEIFANRLTRFVVKNHSFEHFPLPGKNPLPAGIALDSKGNVWIAEQGTNCVAVVVRTDLSYIEGEEATPTQAKVVTRPHQFLEFEVPTPNSIPGIVEVDRHGTVWFTEMGGGWVGPGFPPGPPGSKIGYIRDGELKELKTPTEESGPTSIGLDPCGDDVWISLRSANKIARVRNFQVEEFPISIADSVPIGISVDHDHNVWVALSRVNKIGRRTPKGVWRFLDLPDSTAEPKTVYVDATNEVWFAEKTGNHIGHIDQRAWSFQRYPIPTKVAWPLSLVADKEGNLWFAEMRSDKLGVLDRTTKTITEYQLPVQSAPFKLAYDQEGSALWISTVFYNAILRFDLKQRTLTDVYRVPSEGAWVGGVSMDKFNRIWFSEQFANKIGCLTIAGIAADAPNNERILPSANDTIDPND